MPVVAYSLASSQRPPCAVLVLFFFQLISATQLVLIIIFFQEPIGSRKLITDVTHLLFRNMLSPLHSPVAFTLVEGQEPISGIALDDCDRIEATKNGLRLILSTGLTE